MTKEKQTNQGDNLSEVELALTRTEQFIENNLKVISYAVGGVLALVLLVMVVHKFYLQPKEKEVQTQMFAAQNYFSKDSFNLALNGDGASLGFLDIVDQYGSTAAGNTANYYAGVSYLHLGDYNNAIKYLDKFSSSDLILKPLAEEAKGDAYVELQQYSKALSAFESALKMNDNDLTSPILLIKAGLCNEALGDKAKAIENYKQVKEKFPKSNEMASAEKNIARLSN